MNARTFLIAAAAAAAFVTVPAQAGTTRLATTVEYADLDLTSPAGAAALERRVRAAVIGMCGSYERRNGMGERPLGRCIRAANIEPQVAAIIAAAQRQSRRGASELAAK